MRQGFASVVVVCCVCSCVCAEGRSLALYLKDSGGLTAESTEVMRSELRRLLDPAGIDVTWRDFTELRTGQGFDLVVVGSIGGSCASEVDFAQKSDPHGLVHLADTSISENRILPFFVVDCSRVRRVLGDETGPPAIGRALARVIGHELYHILTKTATHGRAGIAKAVFSAHDLVGPGFDFDSRSLAQIRSAESGGDSLAASLPQELVEPGELFVQNVLHGFFAAIAVGFIRQHDEADGAAVPADCGI